MADLLNICPVCDKKIGLFSPHLDCTELFLEDPEKYGGKAIEKTDDQIKAEVQREEQQQEQEEKALYKSVRIKGGVDINSFDMPFGDMVIFMVKWAIASIPAFIILAIIGAIFGSLFF